MSFVFIAHRGASADAPDNTAQAFQLAVEQGADLIETDVQLTQDGVLVLEHDFEVRGQSVAASRLAELRALKPDMLTVGAALAQFGSQIPFCWEVKAPGAETALVSLIQDIVPAEIQERTQFTSFFFGIAVMLRRLAPASPVGWLTREWSAEAVLTAQAAGLSQICPPAEAVLRDPALVATAQAAGLHVRAWSVSTPDIVPDLIRAGVYGGTVNWPAAARAAAVQHP